MMLRRFGRLLIAIPALISGLPASARDSDGFGGNYQPGSIVIITQNRELYFVLGGGHAIRYPVGIGRAGMA
jgi:lipoprotein-anchoring transpeptidase ErfK/SrfK